MFLELHYPYDVINLSEMGNHLGRSDDVKENARKHSDEYMEYLSTQENSILVETFHALSKQHRSSQSPSHIDKNITKAASVTDDTESDVYEDVFYAKSYENFHLYMIKQGVYRNEALFRKYIVMLTRMSSSTTVQTLWDVIRSNASSSNGLDIVKAILLIYHDYSFSNRLSKEIVSKNVEKIMQHIMCRQNGTIDSKTDLDMTMEDFMDWTNSFAPFAPKTVETYVHRICWNDEMVPDFKPFCAPFFMDAVSSIVSEVDLLPLGMYSDRLQGSW